MSEWWTYRPSDFLMFAPRAWWRLLELHNAAAWPLQPLLLLTGAALLVALWRGTARQAVCRAALALLGLAGLATAWFFLWWRFAPIHWAAEAYAWFFAALALGLLVLAAAPQLQTAAESRRQRTGLALAAAALAWPLLAPAFGRPWAQAEVLALAPDPTALAVLALLLLIDLRHASLRALSTLLRTGAIGWLLLSAATLLTMGEAQGVAPLLAVVVAVVAGWRPRRGQRGQPQSELR